MCTTLQSTPAVWEMPAADVDTQTFCQQVLDHGYAAVRCSEHQTADYVAFSDAIGHDFVVQGTGAGQHRMVGGNNGRYTIDNIPGLFIETGPNQLHEAPFHGELYFHHRTPPQALWAYCHTAGSQPGRLQLCDGIKLFEALPGHIQQLLQRERIMYVRHHDAADWQRLYQTTDLDEVRSYLEQNGIGLDALPDGAIRTRFVCSALWPHGERLSFVNNIIPFARRQINTPEATRARVCLASGELFPAEVFEVIWQTALAVTEYWYWQRGDILLLDNTRTLHGREPLSETGREIFIRLSHARFLDAVAPRG